MKKLLFVPFLLAASLTCLFLGSCKTTRISISDTRIALGSYVRIVIVVRKENQKKAEKHISNAFSSIQDWEGIFDHRIKQGSLYRFNNDTILLKKNNPLLYSTITESIAYSSLTEGYFDPTVLPVVQVWGWDTKNPHLPDKTRLRKALTRVGYQKVSIQDHTITKPLSVKLDLGGVAKGKIVDITRNYLHKQGFQHFLIDAGGDIYVSGKNEHQKKWRIAIQHPLNPDRYWGILQKSNTAIVTSGDYEQFFEENGTRYTHLINPKNGYPYSDCKSVTLLADNAAFADAVATAVFIMGSKEGFQFLKDNHIPGLIIYNGPDSKLKTMATEDFWE